MLTTQEAHFRDIPKPQSCESCANTTHTMHQGTSQCTVVDTLIGWSQMQWKTCNLWKAKHAPTEREQVLKKLTSHDRKYSEYKLKEKQ